MSDFISFKACPARCERARTSPATTEKP